MKSRTGFSLLGLTFVRSPLIRKAHRLKPVLLSRRRYAGGKTGSPFSRESILRTRAISSSNS
jgi:hypothetical protein